LLNGWVSAVIAEFPQCHQIETFVAIDEEVFPYEVLTQAPEWDKHIGQDDEGRDREEGKSAFYRITFPNNQGGRYYPGIPPFPGTPSAVDCITEVHNEETGQWGPLPPGHCTPRQAGGDEEEAERAARRRAAASCPDDKNWDWGNTPSGSDYSGDWRVKDKDRANQWLRGKSTSDTEQEDEEDNRDFANSAVPDSILSKHHSQLNQGSPTLCLTKAHKGKGRDGGDVAADIDSVHEQGTHESESVEDDAMDVDTDPEPLHSHKAAWRFFKEEVKEVDAFGCRVNEEVVQLANKWHCQPHNIMFQAGLGTRLSRQANPYNEFRSWYASVHKKEVDSMLSHHSIH